MLSRGLASTNPQICGVNVLAVENEQRQHTCYLSFSLAEHDRV